MDLYGVGNLEVVGREDELVRPSLKLLDAAVGAGGGFEGALHGGADGHYLVLGILGGVDHLAALLVDEHLLGVHLVLRLHP